jgi:tetraprenyl-beta-curcumene synthase
VSTFGDRRLVARAGGALVLANARYWPTVAPHVRAQLDQYQQRARTISDPLLRAQALDKLSDQGFHAQVAATLATLAPRTHRRQALTAIVAFEVIYDYLDGLTEQPATDPLGNGHRLFEAFTDAFNTRREPASDYYALHPRSDDSGYLQSLVADARQALAQLPATSAIAGVAQRCIARFGEAQVRAHAVPQLGRSQFERWAARNATGTKLGWLEYFAGATSSILGLHALVAAAANPCTTPEQAQQIDATYLYIGVIVTMLDSLIDYERDIATTGEPGYTRYYGNPEQLARGLTNASHQAVLKAHATPNASHHVMTLTGVVAFYTSAPTSNGQFARPFTKQIRRELQPLITPTLAVMHIWRHAKRLRRWWQKRSATTNNDQPRTPR